jgi:hypothetical protein
LVTQGWKDSDPKKTLGCYIHFQAFTEEYWCVYISTHSKDVEARYCLRMSETFDLWAGHQPMAKEVIDDAEK